MYPYWWLPFWLNVVAFLFNIIILVTGSSLFPFVTILCVVLTGPLIVMCGARIIENGQSFLPWR